MDGFIMDGNLNTQVGNELFGDVVSPWGKAYTYTKLFLTA